MAKKSRRFLALVLTLILAFSLLPISGIADGGTRKIKISIAEFTNTNKKPLTITINNTAYNFEGKGNDGKFESTDAGIPESAISSGSFTADVTYEGNTYRAVTFTAKNNGNTSDNSGNGTDLYEGSTTPTSPEPEPSPVPSPVPSPDPTTPAEHEYVNAKVYLYLESNTVPSNINHGFAAEYFGPSKNDVPYFTVQVDMTKLLADGTIYKNFNDGKWYISQDNKDAAGNSMGTAETIWAKILDAMSAEDQQKFTDTFGEGVYLGYVLKNEGTPHIDGILKVQPPIYHYDVIDVSGATAVTAATATQTTTPYKASDVVTSVNTWLAATYGAINIDWTNKSFADNSGKRYTFTFTAEEGRGGIDITNNTVQYVKAATSIDYNIAAFDLAVTAVPTYTVTYENYDGTALQVLTKQHSGDAIAAFTGDKPAKAASGGNTYTFAGWKLTSGVEGANSTIGKTDLVYTAQFNGVSAGQYMVIYTDGTNNGATYNYAQNYVYQTYAPMADNSTTNFARTGYTFNGWKLRDGSNVNGTGSTLSGNSGETIYYDAQWKQNEYTLTIHYVYSNGTKAADDYTSTVAYADPYSVNSPVIGSYTPSVSTVSGVMPAKNVEVTVTYTYQGGYDPTVPPTTPPTTDITDPDVPTTDIPDPETPTTDITDPETPKADASQQVTGDELVLWIALACMSAMALVYIIVVDKKRKDNPNK